MWACANLAKGRKEQQVFKYLLLLSLLLFGASCSDRALSIFFDIPPPTKEELAAKARAEAEAKAAVAAARAAGNGAQATQSSKVSKPSVTRKPPEIEKAKTWALAKKFFPMDREGRKGRPDWTEAARRGIIAPQESVDGSPRPPGGIFKYDFFIPAPESDPGFEAYFPHSTHTEWISCESCHPKIFPVRGVTITKKEIKKGKYCGVCHTKRDGPAFWLRACDRCHLLAKD